MKLFNKTIDNKLFKQYQFGSDLSKQKVVAKIFNPYGNGRWYIINSDPNDPDYLWAIVDLGYGAEVGSVSRNELESYRNKMGLSFERDLYFDDINAEKLYEGLLTGEYYAEGGQTIDAFQMRLVRGVGNKPSEVLTTEQEVKFAKGGAVNLKYDGYLPTYKIGFVHTKDGKVFENIYSDSQVISGVYFSDKPLRDKDQKDKNQMELFKKGGMPKTAIYIPRYNVDFIETEDGEKIEGNYIYGGIWVDLKKQFRLVEEAKKEGRFDRKNEKPKFEAIYNGKKISIEAENLLDAKNKAIVQLKVPKSKVGLLSVYNVKDPMALLYKNGGNTNRKIEIINEGENFDEKKYKAIYGDYDKDGTANIDDANPLNKNKKGTVEQVELKETFTKLLKVKAELDSVMYSAIDKIDDKAPKDADIYARTKTPYSILKKLVDKRMLDPQKGLTDIIGTTIAVENQKELEQVRDDIDGGLLGKILDRDDYYENPKAGYRAYHYIVEYNGYPIEVQLKTKNMKKLNEVSHEFYKNGTLDPSGLESVSKTFEMADRGNKKAIQEVANLLKNRDELASKISTKKSFDNGGSISDADKTKLIYVNQILRRAVINGDLTIDEANSGLAFEIAEEEVEEFIDDDMEEMGSSDFGYMYKNFIKSYNDVKTQSFERGGDVLPPSKVYGDNIYEAMNKFNITDSEARKKYGNYTINQWNELLGKKTYAKGGSIKDTEITKGKVFKLINGDVIEIVRLFKENIDEDWVEYKRNGEKKENSVKELRLFINRLSGKKEKSFREKRNEYLEKLGEKEADVWDKIGAESGSEIRNNDEMLKAYAESVEEMLQKQEVGKGSFDQEDYDYFQDENLHLFNEFLVWNGYYEPEMTKTEKAWREKNYADPNYRNYVSNPKIISLSKKPSNYVPKAKIKQIILEKDGKKIVLDSKDVLNGVNLYEGGGKLKNDHVYFAKRFVKEVITEDGDKLKPSNGYWVKKSALKGSKKEGVSYAGGGKTTFKEKATAIAKNFEGKKVKAKYQKEYGKTYDKAEAKEVGNKIAGSQKAKYDSKMSGGGSTKRGGAMILAKEIRKDGESWQSALKRAYEQLKK
jgi:ppGpp synthetase/RelA/SpoT-type nucleotidyltranferase